MGQQKARVDDVEPLRHPLTRRADAELDVVEPLRRHRVAGEADRGGIHVDPHDPAARPDLARELDRAVAAAAADVETDHPGGDAGAREHGARRGPHGAREDAQSIDAARPAVDDVLRRVGAAHGSNIPLRSA